MAELQDETKREKYMALKQKLDKQATTANAQKSRPEEKQLE
jgi:hypothetical protein